MSGSPDIGILNVQVGYSRPVWARLEGWPQAPNFPPSFETGAARPPQDEVVQFLTQ